MWVTERCNQRKMAYSSEQKVRANQVGVSEILLHNKEPSRFGYLIHQLFDVAESELTTWRIKESLICVCVFDKEHLNVTSYVIN